MVPQHLSKSILVVEDDRDIRETLAGLLSDDGYEVSACSNGLEALEHLRAGGHADVILLDLMMPVVDGWEFRVEQKQDRRFASIPVLALSADGTAKAAAIDADGYLHKPVEYAHLVETIERTVLAAERRNLQAILVETERLASLGTLAAGLAHEINNPLTYVMMNLDELAGFVEKSLDEGELPRRAVAEMREGCVRIRSIVRDLQLLSRTPGDDETPVDVCRVLDSSANIVMHEIRARAALTRDYGDVPLLPAVETRLAQVFLNLVLNAAHAIPAGDPEHNEIRLTARAEGRDVIVEVTDTGAGIAPEIRGKIFEPFFTTKPLGVGTGLGLSISNRIVDAMGGQLTVESEPGRGSTFRVRLPIADRPARVASPPPAGAHSSAWRARILVIDDEPTIATVLVRILGQRYDVEAETNPEEALARFARGERFDLVLCDLVMPGRSGMDVHAAIARLCPEQAERMIFITGGAVTPAAREFVAKRPDRVVYKPFPVDELVAQVATALALFAHGATA